VLCAAPALPDNTQFDTHTQCQIHENTVLCAAPALPGNTQYDIHTHTHTHTNDRFTKTQCYVPHLHSQATRSTTYTHTNDRITKIQCYVPHLHSQATHSTTHTHTLQSQKHSAMCHTCTPCQASPMSTSVMAPICCTCCACTYV
jgi:hypothetical protein